MMFSTNWSLSYRNLILYSSLLIKIVWASITLQYTNSNVWTFVPKVIVSNFGIVKI